VLNRNLQRVFCVVALASSALGAMAQENSEAVQGALEQSSATNIMVQEIEYVAPSSLATPCPTKEPGVQVEGCVEPDPRDAAKAFKMNVPADWDVRQSDGVNALFMEPKQKAVATAENPIVADPNISVKVTKNPIPIDEKGLEEFAEEIEKGLNQTEQGVENPEGRLFKVFNKSFVNLPQGQKAYFYYVQGAINEISVRKAILVASTQLVRYRVELTDTEQNFDKSLEKYFPVMTSLQLSGPSMERASTFVAVLPWVLGFFAIVGFFVGVKIVRLRNTQKLIAEVDSEWEERPAESTPERSVAQSDVKKSRVSKSEYPDDEY
jgi:hypothetical protein